MESVKININTYLLRTFNPSVAIAAALLGSKINQFAFVNQNNSLTKTGAAIPLYVDSYNIETAYRIPVEILAEQFVYCTGKDKRTYFRAVEQLCFAEILANDWRTYDGDKGAKKGSFKRASFYALGQNKKELTKTDDSENRLHIIKTDSTMLNSLVNVCGLTNAIAFLCIKSAFESFKDGGEHQNGLFDAHLCTTLDITDSVQRKIFASLERFRLIDRNKDKKTGAGNYVTLAASLLNQKKPALNYPTLEESLRDAGDYPKAPARD